MRPLKRAAQRRLSLQPARLLATTTTDKDTPLSSLLIANRGEIALRIHRTASRMGIPTTTLYTPVDAAAQHARASPRSLALGSYLDGDRIIALALQHGIRALHPGYGFLSENAAFADRCAQAGITFVGPPAQAMADMGDKARSKALMAAAGVPVVPGYHGSDQSPDQLAQHAAQIGYPVLLKSVRGGGGKGMRIVRTPAEFPAQLRSARAEAAASFGAGGEVMLVERYIERPRHVEVQVFADQHGHAVALGERDCSIQRRHQKVLEESPAPGLDESLRQALWECARKAALAVSYVGAGTVEFILDRDALDDAENAFFFMEMNTRLQVEHPVTELVTGLDLVEWQLRIAAGEPLPLTQDAIEAQIRTRGHAIEARIYAENPERGFLPDSGRLLHLATPAVTGTNDEHADVRIDAGFVQGDVVSEAYDGMLAKLIVRGADRPEALRKLALALESYEVAGLHTNVMFLQRLCRSPAFVAGDVDTGFIERWRDELFAPHTVADETYVQAALALLVGERETENSLHGPPLGFGEGSIGSTAARLFAFEVVDAYSDRSGDVVEVSLAQTAPQKFQARVSWRGSESAADENENDDGQTYKDIVLDQAAIHRGDYANHIRLASLFPTARCSATVVEALPETDDVGPVKLTVFTDGRLTQLVLVPPEWHAKVRGGDQTAGLSVAAPMPCKILRNEVRVGEHVEKGAPLVVIESMKMETVIHSPQAGVIRKLAHEAGDICKAGTVLVLFEEEEETEAETKR